MARIGCVQLPPPLEAVIDVWWLRQYAGGLFLPLRDGTAGQSSYGGALELLFVFGYLAVAGSRRVKVKRRDWLAAVAMSAGIGLFLRVASPLGRTVARAGLLLVAGWPGHVRSRAPRPGRGLRSG